MRRYVCSKHGPHAEEEDDEGDIAVRHRVPARERVLEVVGKADPGPDDAVGTSQRLAGGCGSIRPTASPTNRGIQLLVLWWDDML